MPEFHGAADHDRYVQWLRAHPDGYVLQFNQVTDIKLHRASCRWIGGSGATPPRGRIWTTYRKQCSDSRRALAAISTQHCRFCNP
jgi:hypothetical protein